MAEDLVAQAGEILDRYLEHFPDDAARLSVLREQLAEGQEMFRKNFRGHLTACAIVLNPAHDALLMVHHVALDRWLQPGGHLEPSDKTLLAASKREVAEEVGLTDVQQITVFGDKNMPLYIDTLYIPANPKKDEPEHYHHDFRYLFEAESGELTLQLEEVHDAAWVPLEDERIGDLRATLQRISKISVV